MFVGWSALFAVSYLAYRRAAAVNRSPWLWAVLAWAFSFGGGLAAVFVGVGFYLARGAAFITEREATEALLMPSAVGMLVGAVVCVCLAGRNVTQSNQRDKT